MDKPLENNGLKILDNDTLRFYYLVALTAGVSQGAPCQAQKNHSRGDVAMTMITRWDPFREMATLQDRMNRLFQDFGHGNEELMTTGSFVPPVDIYEDEHAITVKMEIPGIDEKDLDIRLENSTLTVRGERKLEKEEKEE